MTKIATKLLSGIRPIIQDYIIGQKSWIITLLFWLKQCLHKGTSINDFQFFLVIFAPPPLKSDSYLLMSNFWGNFRLPSPLKSDIIKGLSLKSFWFLLTFRMLLQKLYQSNLREMAIMYISVCSGRVPKQARNNGPWYVTVGKFDNLPSTHNFYRSAFHLQSKHNHTVIFAKMTLIK